MVLPLLRLHDARGVRSNVPREARYFTERGKDCKTGNNWW